MKSIIAVSGILGLIWFCSTAFSQSQPQTDVPDDYAYLTRLHVRSAVINCIAELDRWVRTTSRYDMFLAPDRRVLKANVDGGSGIFSGSNGAQSVESTVTMRAFARLRSKQSWIPVVAKCGIWREHVVGVSLRKYEGHTPVVS
ncbi:hypothetical protein AB4Y32_26490 [Paraburkholderia phymatum]|uniref:Uncharacterized protein n=1 Tax=Paraburkholderia phymatum TaxID=148447 RepID=A0ACC6U6N4_9BURK